MNSMSLRKQWTDTDLSDLRFFSMFLQKILRSIHEKMTAFSGKENKDLPFNKSPRKLSRHFRVFVKCQ